MTSVRLQMFPAGFDVYGGLNKHGCTGVSLEARVWRCTVERKGAKTFREIDESGIVRVRRSEGCDQVSYCPRI
jgi:hypothetical protein